MYVLSMLLMLHFQSNFVSCCVMFAEYFTIFFYISKTRMGGGVIRFSGLSHCRFPIPYHNFLKLMTYYTLNH